MIRRIRLSLRLRLMVVIGISLLVLWSGVSLWMLVDVRQQVDQALDDRLAASARMVAGLMAALPVDAGADGRAGAMDVIGRDGLACEVSLVRGEVSRRTIARTSGSPRLERIPLGFSSHMFGGKPWRIYVLEENNLRIATADRLDNRAQLQKEIVLAAAVPFAVAFLGMLLAVGGGVNWGLAPFERFRRSLATRKPGDGRALPMQDCPLELQPMRQTIDGLIQRVQAALILERRFIDAAAHELRTPLTGIKLHVQIAALALKQGAGASLAEADEALRHASHGAQRLQHLLDQLLELARIDADHYQASATCVSLAIDDWRLTLPAAQRDRLSVHTGAAGDCRVKVPEMLFHTVIGNLVDNAMKYSPPDTIVELYCAQAGDELRLDVHDRGSGISDANRERVLQRFWRESQAVSGSGLGLSVVKAILERFGGRIEIRPRDGGGTSVHLALPRIT